MLKKLVFYEDKFLYLYPLSKVNFLLNYKIYGKFSTKHFYE